MKISDLATFEISNSMRGYLLRNIVEYYHLHFGNLGEIRSLKVLNEMFSSL
jgi:hypothetical protein